MKYIITALLICAMLPGCTTVQKLKDQHKINKAAKIRAKTDSVAHTSTDSTNTLKQTATHVNHTVETIDTNVQVGGQTLTGIGTLPDTGKSTLFTNGDVTTEVGIDATGKLVIHTNVKPKTVAVKKTTTSDTYDAVNTASKTEVSTAANIHVKKDIKADSTRHETTIVKHTEKHTLFPWWLWLIIVLAVIVFICWKYKLY